MKILDSVGWNFSVLILNSFLLLNICVPKIKWEVEIKIWAENEICYSFQPSFKYIKVVKGGRIYINTFEVSGATLIYWKYKTELTNFHVKLLLLVGLCNTECFLLKGETKWFHTLRWRAPPRSQFSWHAGLYLQIYWLNVSLQRSHNLSFSGIKITRTKYCLYRKTTSQTTLQLLSCYLSFCEGRSETSSWK